MKKIFFSKLFLINTLIIFGQNIKVLPDFSEPSGQLKLSAIAENVNVIPLEINTEALLYTFMTPEYIFTVSHSSVYQFDFKGKFIRKIDCGGIIANTISGDKMKKELYIPVKKELKVFDFSGNLKKIYKLENMSNGCFYYNNTLWIQSHKLIDNETLRYEISYLDLLTGKEFFLPIKEEIKMEDGLFFRINPGNFFVNGNTVFFAFQNSENTLYKIQKQNQRIISTLMLKILLPNKEAVTNKKEILDKGFIGKYLFVDYIIEDTRYLFIEDMKIGNNFHIMNDLLIIKEGITDDLFNSGKNRMIKQFNLDGYFYFTKTKETIKEKSIDGKLVKDGVILFIVKAK